MNLLLALLILANDPLQDVRFVMIQAGRYLVGAPGHACNPRREVELDCFEISATEVTNRQFAGFIESTGYLTDAETNGFGMTFREGMDDWHWDSTPGATWRLPFGPDGPGTEDKPNHPVTQISIRDARAYCRWAGVRLPTVAEWEVAARGPYPVNRRYPWGDELAPKGEYLANTWQGESHHQNSLEDGHLYTAPVASYPPNDWGLYDVIGNVFEYVEDPTALDEKGNPLAAGRGGSWWCSEKTCSYYNLYDVGRQNVRATLANQGFRVVRDPER